VTLSSLLRSRACYVLLLFGMITAGGNQSAFALMQDGEGNAATVAESAANEETAEETAAAAAALAAAQAADAMPPIEAPATKGIDQKIDEAFKPIATRWEKLVTASSPKMPFVLLTLVVGAVFFTIVFGFPNIRLFALSLRVVSGKYDKIEKAGTPPLKTTDVNVVDGDVIGTIRDEKESGEVSHFQALATAVSGTVGLGNISGVAVAIAMGGPGATFWMIVCGLLGMSTKFVECTLGVCYRDVEPDGTVHGGPMYYLRKGLGELGFGPLGRILGVVFAVLCVGASFGGGNMFQSNQATAQVQALFQIDPTVEGWQQSSGAIIGLVMAILVAVVIIGGIKRIATVTEKVVPLMALIYVAAALIIILANITKVPAAFIAIFNGAFNPEAGVGGLVGVIIVGFQRAAFSNEAGAGSAAIAHSAVRTRFPASEGVVALLEPFIDTVVICTMTALVIVLFNDGGNQFNYGDVDPNSGVF
jgi:alanine or glycine:cation symporter, AGCS family